MEICKYVNTSSLHRIPISFIYVQASASASAATLSRHGWSSSLFSSLVNTQSFGLDVDHSLVIMALKMASLTSTVFFFYTLIFSASAIRISNTTTTNPSSTAAANTAANITAAVAFNSSVTNCFVTLPDNALTAEGLATPFLLMPPCSMAVGTQQAFAEAAVFDPATGDISIYHPLILDAGKTAQVAPVVPTLPAGASIGLWFGFNGDTLQLLDINGLDTNSSPKLAEIKCINGDPGVQGDVFGQVSWCNTEAFFGPVVASIASGKTQVPPLGTSNDGQDCPSSRAFTVVDQDPSDNLPTQYLLLPDGSTVQDTAATRAQFLDATVIDNASDEALIGDIIDPLIGCTPFKVNSLDDPGTLTSSLATQELQAGLFQKTPLALVATGDPDCLLTADGSVSTTKTNAYRIGVNQPLLGAANSNDGNTLDFCNGMAIYAPPFFVANQEVFTGQATPDPTVGNNLFTFMCNRYLQSFSNLVCTPTVTQPVRCQLDENGVATFCNIALSTNSTISIPSLTAAESNTSLPTTLPTSTSVLTATAAKNASSTVSLSSISHSISMLPTLTLTTGTASINSATVTVKPTSAPLTSAHPHPTFPYSYPRHHHHGGFFGRSFNPATVTHAIGTTAFVPSTTAPSATPTTQNSQALVISADFGATSPGVAAAGVAPSLAGVFPSLGPTSFVTVTMTVTAGGASGGCSW